MKTNLTTKQIKKIKNGKLAVFKDIDTAEAREYLFNVLDWLFPKDTSSKQYQKECVFKYKYFSLNTLVDHKNNWAVNRPNLQALPLSQIMYTYNTEQFKPISMPCTEEQWSNDLKPVVEAFGFEIGTTSYFDEYGNITNFYDAPNVIGTINDALTVWSEINNHLKSYSPAEFLEACGIVRVDKEQTDENLDCLRFTFDLSSLYDRNNNHTITTDQIKTARTNPETLEELFPKVFEKPVVEVGKWWYIKSKCSNFEYKFYITKNENGQLYGYGFDEESVWHNENPLIREHVIESATLCNLSDLQPLFEVEFNKRYKEGDLLESPSGALRFYYSKGNVEVLRRFNKVRNNGIRLFHDGNFAKVIKSADLIKAEEELEQAKKRVEELKGKC